MHMDCMTRGAKRVAMRMVQMMWPSRSLISGQQAHGSGPMSVEDWTSLNFLAGPVCNMCGSPQAIDLGTRALCAACSAKPPRWTRARAALAYDDNISRPILGLKRAGRRDGLKTMAGWMVGAGRPLLQEADLLVPVPMHRQRLAMRGFNQAVWLAAAVGREADVPLNVTALRRIKATPTQGGLSAQARRRNVAGAFSVRERQRRCVYGRRIVLVDDVHTTGATLNACTLALRRAGAADVDALVLARVVRERDVTI